MVTHSGPPIPAATDHFRLARRESCESICYDAGVHSAPSGRNGSLRWSRHVAAVALLCAAAMFAGSCRQTLLGDRVDVATEICALLQDCYGEEYSCQTVEAQLRAASPDVRAAFLGAFTAEACLGSCPGARACLDVEPFCQSGGGCVY